MEKQIVFLGKIHPAECECHKGQFLALIFMSRPGHEPDYITNVPFKTEKEAKEEMPTLLQLAADELMKASGLTVKKSEKLEGDQAEAFAEKLRLGSNVVVH